MFNFQKHRRNRHRIDELPVSAALGRMFRFGDLQQTEPQPVVIIGHSPALEARIAARIQRKLDTILIADGGSSVGVSLHPENLRLEDVLPAPKIQPLDISEMFGRNRSQR